MGIMEAEEDFTSSFITQYRNAQHLFLLKLEDDQCILEIYHNANKIEQFTGLISDDVWKKDYKLQDKELRAWHAMFKTCGYSNIITFSHEESQIEFWSRTYNNKTDRQILENLYNSKLLNIDNKKEDLLWKSFCDAINSNKKGQNGKIRILSIIILKFKYKDLIQELGVASSTITDA
ncbi:hypothetical protein C1645_731870 [Glomus cerebriforme]|uniref:Uncharacterized protein n=1 Tax=Glomus cerebriforme TaxID=658196 RepID=A0A397TL37_9GLOM|nr:hypothetical protein C1645_731870 [Glomus cerebriforme]